MLFLFVSNQLAFAEDCDDPDLWGQILPDDVFAAGLEESIDFYVGARECGDTDECDWAIEDPTGLSTLSQNVGSPVSWTAPEVLEDCVSVDIRLFLSCPNLDGSGAYTTDDLTLTVNCSLSDKESLIGAQDWSIGGGGCGTGASAAMIFLVPLLGFRRYL